jgi:hypothetical protein
MTPDELLAKLNAPEDGFIERKSNGIKPSDLLKAMAAFANSLPDGRQGVIFIGIGDRGSIEGCESPDAVQKRVREAGNECYPPIAPQCTVLKVQDKDVVAVVVSSSLNKPHFTGPAYVRQGSESIKASKQLFDEMVDSRHSPVAAIIRLIGMTITVIGLGHKLGHSIRVADRYRESTECKVVSCDAHTVTMLRTVDSWLFYEAVSRIEISMDGQMKRPALIVKRL